MTRMMFRRWQGGRLLESEKILCWYSCQRRQSIAISPNSLVLFRSVFDGSFHHQQSPIEKSAKFQRSRERLGLLQSMTDDEWHHRVTLEESWFVFRVTANECGFLLSRNPKPKRRRLSAPRRTMPVVRWNPSAFHVVDVLPKRKKFNSDYHLSNLSRPICMVSWHSELFFCKICDPCL
jgi:hypothetical protein